MREIVSFNVPHTAPGYTACPAFELSTLKKSSTDAPWLCRFTFKPASVYVLTERINVKELATDIPKGNQIGAAFWQQISGEHGLDGAGV